MMPVKTLMRLLFVLGDGSRRKKWGGGVFSQRFPRIFQTWGWRSAVAGTRWRRRSARRPGLARLDLHRRTEKKQWFHMQTGRDHRLYCGFTEARGYLCTPCPRPQFVIRKNRKIKVLEGGLESAAAHGCLCNLLFNGLLFPRCRTSGEFRPDLNTDSCACSVSSESGRSLGATWIL